MRTRPSARRTEPVITSNVSAGSALEFGPAILPILRKRVAGFLNRASQTARGSAFDRVAVLIVEGVFIILVDPHFAALMFENEHVVGFLFVSRNYHTVALLIDRLDDFGV